MFRDSEYDTLAGEASPLVPLENLQASTPVRTAAVLPPCIFPPEPMGTVFQVSLSIGHLPRCAHEVWLLSSKQA